MRPGWYAVGVPVGIPAGAGFPFGGGFAAKLEDIPEGAQYVKLSAPVPSPFPFPFPFPFFGVAADEVKTKQAETPKAETETPKAEKKSATTTYVVETADGQKHEVQATSYTKSGDKHHFVFDGPAGSVKNPVTGEPVPAGVGPLHAESVFVGGVNKVTEK